MKYLVVCLLMLNIIYPAVSQDNVLYSGTWKADSYFTTFEGSWKIIQKGEKKFILLGEDFEAKKAPDLKIFLSKLSLEEINSDNASTPDNASLVAELKKFKGSYEYSIPEGVSLEDYTSIIIHCEKYSKLWGGALLSKN